MFNKERLRQLADQARQAGNRLANQASGAVQNAQLQLNRSRPQSQQGQLSLEGGAEGEAGERAGVLLCSRARQRGCYCRGPTT